MNSAPTSASARGDASTIVELGVQDAGEILTLQRAAYITEAAAHQDFNLPPLTQTLAELEAELSDSAVTAFGIREHGRLTGAVRLRRHADVIELGRLIVAPDRQGRGLGTRLLRHAEAVFPNAREIRLFTGEHSAANVRLYERLGYRESGSTVAGTYHLIHFVKPLA